MSNPKIDKRTGQEFEKQIKALATTYLPEWKPQTGEPGWAVAQSFAKMSEELIKRLNAVPEKLFLDYLDRLDFKLNPPLSAKVPVTFELIEGIKEQKTVPESTQVADAKQVIFESDKTFSATPAKLAAFYSVKESHIYNHITDLNNKTEFSLFFGDKIQETNNYLDGCFYNDVSLDITKPFKPFGAEPKLYDSFYIASSKAFSKDIVTIKITLSEGISSDQNIDNPKIVWEYWNGTSWKNLNIDYDFKKEDETLTFRCSDIKETKVNGEKNYWIRARLISGNFGSYGVEKTDNDDGTSSYKRVPLFTELEVTNLEVTFSPPVDYQLDSGLYAGFNRAFGEGLISIFFAMPKKYWDLYQYLEWSYYSKEGWKPLNVKDGTKGLIQSGICEFPAPLDQSKNSILDQNLFWLKIKIVEKDLAKTTNIPKIQGYQGLMQRLVYSKYYMIKKSKFRFIQKPVTSIKPCKSDLMPFHPALHLDKDEKDAQIQIDGIYLNTVWATQSESVKEEYVGSSDGSANQKFRLLRAPAREIQVWVKELLEPEDKKLTYYADEEKGFWVLWNEIVYIYDALATSRAYSLDAVSGEIRFGDGIYGLIPPIGKDNIKAGYQTGGGKKGNVPKEKVKTLVSTISSMDKIKNHIEASGGSDAESIENLIKRAPKTLRVRDRAITFEDYEILTKESSTDVAKVKAIPNFNNFGKYETNWLTAVIAPYSQEIQPECSEELIRNVKSYLDERSPIITNIQVISPKYAMINLEIDIVLKKWNLIPVVKEEAQKKLASFLHPIYGGYDDTGWEFGTLPCFSDFFALLEKIDGIEYIKTLTMKVVAGDKTVTITSDETPVLDIAPYILACSGTHILNMEGA